MPGASMTAGDIGTAAPGRLSDRVRVAARRGGSPQRSDKALAVARGHREEVGRAQLPYPTIAAKRSIHLVRLGEIERTPDGSGRTAGNRFPPKKTEFNMRHFRPLLFSTLLGAGSQP